VQVLEQLVGVVEQVEGGLVGRGIDGRLLEAVLGDGAQAKVAHGLHVGDRLLELVLLLVGLVLLLLAAPVQLRLLERREVKAPLAVLGVLIIGNYFKIIWNKLKLFEIN